MPLVKPLHASPKPSQQQAQRDRAKWEWGGLKTVCQEMRSVLGLDDPEFLTCMYGEI